MKYLNALCGKYRFVAVICAVLSNAIAVQAQEEEMPDHDISVFDLTVSADGVQIANQRVIANRIGYDNQPRFIDNQSLYYTSMEDINADIWHWQLDKNNNSVNKRLTSTLESEYSPTPTPFKKGAFSTIRVEHDSTQRLWQVNPDGSFELLFKDIKPVGYHVWQQQNIAMFVLGEPHRLEVTRLGQEATKVVDRAIGRTLLNVPGSDKISYSVERDGRHQIKLYSFANDAIDTLMLLPGNSQDYAWLGEGKLISSDGERLQWTNVPDGQWQSVSLSDGLALKGISRIAVSPNGKRIAIVHHK